MAAIKDYFLEASDPQPPTIEELAQRYVIEELPELYEDREQDVFLLNFEYSNSVWDEEDGVCDLMFSYLDDIWVGGSVCSGFKLDFVKEGTDESLASIIHVADRNGDRFGKCIAHMKDGQDVEEGLTIDPVTSITSLIRHVLVSAEVSEYQDDGPEFTLN